MPLGDPRDWGDYSQGPFDTPDQERAAKRTEMLRRIMLIQNFAVPILREHSGDWGTVLDCPACRTEEALSVYTCGWNGHTRGYCKVCKTGWVE
jgi:hypothetical protein